VLWVDALCINQQDSVERSHHVRQTRQIYSRAKEVISWVPCRSEDAAEYLVKNRFYGTPCETTDQSRKRTKGVHVGSSGADSDPSFEDYENRKEWVKQGWDIMEDFFSQVNLFPY
jgi:hypothetical protein